MPSGLEIPKFTRVFFCIPLSIGLIIWAVIKALVAIAVITVNLVDIRYNNSFQAKLWIPCFVWLTDFIFSSMLICSVSRKNCTIMNITYNYSVAKVFLIPIMLITGGFLAATDPIWVWYRTLDMVTVYLLIDNIALGVIAWILQGYLVLLIRSEILNLGGRPHINLKFKEQCTDMEASDTHTPSQVDSPPTSEPLGVEISPPKYEDIHKDGDKKVESV